MLKREAAFQVKFNRWLRYVYPTIKEASRSAVFELKHDRGRGNIPFDEVQEHQLLALGAVRGEGLAFKIPDDSRSYKPFDCFFAHQIDAYVVPCYGDRFYLIDVSRWIDEASASKRRSLTEQRAAEICTAAARLGSKDVRYN